MYYNNAITGKIYQGSNLLGDSYVGGQPFDPNYTYADGGIVTTSGSFKFHTFTDISGSTFTVHNVGVNPNVNYLIVGGGGGSAYGRLYSAAEPNQFKWGSGGAGGTARTGSYTVSNNNYTITVGAGGLPIPGKIVIPGSSTIFGSNKNGFSGSFSSAFNITASGGEGGNFNGPGGSNADYTGGTVNNSGVYSAAGAGAGQNGTSGNTFPSVGGNGILWSGSYYGGGGGGMNDYSAGGLGGGGQSEDSDASPSYGSGTNGLGGGGGGVAWVCCDAFPGNNYRGESNSGGSGTVIISYQYKA